MTEQPPITRAATRQKQQLTRLLLLGLLKLPPAAAIGFVKTSTDALQHSSVPRCR